jgi:hypothetical protein
MRRAMGVAVFSGMLGVTVFGLVFTPVFYWTVRRLTGAHGDFGKARRRAAAAQAEPAPAASTSKV